VARIDLVDLAHAYRPRPRDPEDFALRTMTLSWEDGGAYALLGPSGCGKTTLLNIISGLLRPSRGRVLFDGRDVTDLPPEARNIAQVFQFPVVYDTMTVYDNLAFPLRNAGAPGRETRRRVEEIADMLELTADLHRRARRLTPDAKQKISLGRGLVRPDVAALLLDEPLTVIDPRSKWLLRRQLKQIHQQLAVSLIYVTHDQTEALTFADRVVVMTEGQVVQSGTPRELFEAPAHSFVGHFIGNPGMNFLPCTVRDQQADIGGAQAIPLGDRPAVAGPLRLGIRPERVEVSGRPLPGGQRAQLLAVQPQGAHTLVSIALEGQKLWAKLPADEAEDQRATLVPGPGWVRLPPEQILLYAPDDGRRVA
jgi:glycerol transport system ATP-binding protein